MIQVKRGTSASWQAENTPLADGQPGYDKDRKKLKIGDGKSSWNELPYSAGLFADEILEEESKAKEKVARNLSLNPFAALFDERPIFTYGSDLPDENTVGKVYLQHYETEPETDYIVSQGKSGIWVYQVWHSGMARCWGIQSLTTTVQNVFDNGVFYSNNTDMAAISYPIEFKEAPCETATLKSPSSTMAWLASYSGNTKEQSGLYRILSPYTQQSKTYGIVLDVKGFVK